MIHVVQTGCLCRRRVDTCITSHNEKTTSFDDYYFDRLASLQMLEICFRFLFVCNHLCMHNAHKRLSLNNAESHTVLLAARKLTTADCYVQQKSVFETHHYNSGSGLKKQSFDKSTRHIQIFLSVTWTSLSSNCGHYVVLYYGLWASLQYNISWVNWYPLDLNDTWKSDR